MLWGPGLNRKGKRRSPGKCGHPRISASQSPEVHRVPLACFHCCAARCHHAFPGLMSQTTHPTEPLLPEVASCHICCRCCSERGVTPTPELHPVKWPRKNERSPRHRGKEGRKEGEAAKGSVGVTGRGQLFSTALTNALESPPFCCK